jgi:hypothetical protein
MSCHFENQLCIDRCCALILRKRYLVKASLCDLQGALAEANEFPHDQIRDDYRPCSLQERVILKRLMGGLLGALADLDEALQLEANDYESLKRPELVKLLLDDEDGAGADVSGHFKSKHLWKLPEQWKPMKQTISSVNKEEPKDEIILTEENVL